MTTPAHDRPPIALAVPLGAAARPNNLAAAGDAA